MHPETIKVGKRGAVVIPALLRRRMGIDEGSVLLVEERDEGVLLRPTVVAPAPIPPGRVGNLRDILESKRGTSA